MNESYLTPEQVNFINYFYEEGTLKDAILRADINYSIYSDWLRSYEFDRAIRIARQNVLANSRFENTLIAQKKLNEILENGIIQRTIKKKVKRGSDNELLDVETTIETKELGVPLAAIKEALSTGMLEKAIQVIASEGYFGDQKAKQLINRAESMTREIAEMIEGNDQNNQQLSEKEVIGLIKKSLLGDD